MVSAAFREEEPLSKKARSKKVDYAVYLVVRVLVFLVQIIPIFITIEIARFAGWVAYLLDKRHRKIARENLKYAFPDHSDAEIEALVLASFRHILMMAVESAVLVHRLNPKTVDKYVRHADMKNFHRTLEWNQSERPVIYLTGHLGNWEVISFGMAYHGIKATVIGRALDNPYLDEYARGLRSATGMNMVDKDGAIDEVNRTMAEGGNLGVVCDQDAGPKGIFVEYFGRPAATFKSIALLSLEHNAPILVVGCVRTGSPLKHLIFMEDEILPEEYGDEPNAVRLITERYTAALERIVRRYPDQYFWLHRRWKSEPRKRKKKPQTSVREAA